MSYFMLPVESLDELERAGISRDARLLFVESVCYSASNLTDGLIRRWGKVSDAEDPLTLARELVGHGILTESDGGFTIVDYKRLQNGWDADRIHGARAQSRERQQRWRDKQRITAEPRNALRDAFLPPSVTGTGQDGTGPDRRDGTGPDGPASAVDAHGVPRAALHAEASPHIYVDKDYLGVCRWCGKSDKQGPHQRGLPKAGPEVVACITELGVPAHIDHGSPDDRWWSIKGTHPLFTVEAHITADRHEVEAGRCNYIIVEVPGKMNLSDGESDAEYEEIHAELEPLFAKERGFEVSVDWDSEEQSWSIEVGWGKFGLQNRLKDLLGVALKHHREAAAS